MDFFDKRIHSPTVLHAASGADPKMAATTQQIKELGRLAGSGIYKRFLRAISTYGEKIPASVVDDALRQQAEEIKHYVALVRSEGGTVREANVWRKAALKQIKDENLLRLKNIKAGKTNADI